MRWWGEVADWGEVGQSTNLAPFSYFNVINHDPPIFITGYAGGFDKAKDSLRNLVDTGECEHSTVRSSLR